MENIASKPQIHEHPVMRAMALLLFLILPLISLAQEEPEMSGKAAKLFQKALEAFEQGDFPKSKDILQKVIKEDSLYVDGWLLLGDVCNEMKEPEGAVHAYSKALALNPDNQWVVYNLLGNTFFDLEHYAEAGVQYRVLLANQELRQDLRVKLVRKLEIADFRQSQLDNPVIFKPENLGSKVNSASEEYMNYLGPESDQLIFTCKSPISDDPMQRDFAEDFFRSFLSDTGWTKAERFSFSPTTKGDAGGLCMSADGKLLFFTACFRRENRGSCDIYYSEKTGADWSDPKNMGPVINSDNWDAQPSLSPDGRTLYFASNREGSLGSSDIWKTEKQPDGSWSKPVNIGHPVNTTDTEMSPFMHFDNKSLYFSSRGHLGMAGQDLFLTTRNEEGWTVPQNLGYPINTSADEINILVTPGGENAYMSAHLPGGYGGYDMYTFRLPEKVRPFPVTYMKGIVYDSDTGKPLSAQFDLIDLERDSIIMHALSSASDGSFLVCVPTGRAYALNVSCPGYLFYSDHFELSGIQIQTDPFLKDIPLQPIRVGNTIVMKNIFFETDMHDLKEDSKPELDKLVEFLAHNSGISVEISGHTDNIGSEEYNMVLSQERADAVKNYLINSSVESSRLTSVGYGYTRPVTFNETEEGRALNRRTEIRITEVRQ
jgi:flagellar motor protein MotB